MSYRIKKELQNDKKLNSKFFQIPENLSEIDSRALRQILNDENTIRGIERAEKLLSECLAPSKIQKAEIFVEKVQKNSEVILASRERRIKNLEESIKKEDEKKLKTYMSQRLKNRQIIERHFEKAKLNFKRPKKSQKNVKEKLETDDNEPSISNRDRDDNDELKTSLSMLNTHKKNEQKVPKNYFEEYKKLYSERIREIKEAHKPLDREKMRNHMIRIDLQYAKFKKDYSSLSPKKGKKLNFFTNFSPKKSDFQKKYDEKFDNYSKKQDFSKEIRKQVLSSIGSNVNNFQSGRSSPKLIGHQRVIQETKKRLRLNLNISKDYLSISKEIGRQNISLRQSQTPIKRIIIKSQNPNFSDKKNQSFDALKPLERTCNIPEGYVRSPLSALRIKKRNPKIQKIEIFDEIFKNSQRFERKAKMGLEIATCLNIGPPDTINASNSISNMLKADKMDIKAAQLKLEALQFALN